MQGTLAQLQVSAPNYTGDEMITSPECPFPKCINKYTAASTIPQSQALIPPPPSPHLRASRGGEGLCLEARKYYSLCDSPLLVLNLMCDLWRWLAPKRNRDFVAKSCMGGLLALPQLLGHLSQAAKRLWIVLRVLGRLAQVSKKNSFPPFPLLGS